MSFENPLHNREMSREEANALMKAPTRELRRLILRGGPPKRLETAMEKTRAYRAKKAKWKAKAKVRAQKKHLRDLSTTPLIRTAE